MMRSKYLILYLWMSLFLSVSLYAGISGKISGRVTDAETGEPIPGVNIIVVGKSLGAATDLDGYYYIINLSPGTYVLEASYIGYQSQRQTGITVRSDLTTKVNFQLSASIMELETIEIVAKKPPIQKDLTASQQGFSTEEMNAAPVENLSELMNIQAGVNALGSEPSGYVAGAPGDGMHIRGGRENETLFLIDGVKVGDDIYGGSQYIQSTTGGSMKEMKTIIGTFNAEYGGKTGAVVSVVTKDGEDHFSGSVSGYTDKFGINTFDRNTFQGEVSLSGPIPLFNNLSFFVNAQARTTDGRPDIIGIEIPEWRDSKGLVGRVADDDAPEDWIVPLDWRDEWNGMAKLNYRATNTISFSASYFQSWQQRAKYKHTYRYLPYSEPWMETNNNGFIVKMVHTITTSTFYEIIGSFQNTNFFYGIDKTREKKLLYGDRLTFEEWYVSGAVHDYNIDSSQTIQGVFNITSQINNNHLLKSGFEIRHIDVFHRMDNAGGSPVQEIDGEQYESHLAYVERYPLEFSAYAQDKMEFEDIGLIMNAGVRFEYWNPKMEFMEYPNLPFTTDMIKTEPKYRVSPRFGISYPISDKAAFHLAYGHFYQLPRYMELVSGLNDRGYYAGRPNLNDPGPGISNPNAKPEKTVSYETGVQVSLAPSVTMNVTAFYREMADLMGVRWMDGGGGYIYLDNVDFGNAKGVEIRLYKRLSDYWSARLNYTWTTAKISTSSPQTAAQKGRFISYQTFLADWDRPHAFSLTMLVSNPSSWAISMIAMARSGRPYSVLAEQLNTERMPWEINVDLKLGKYFKIAGLQSEVYMRVLNVFDRRNVFSVYSETGKWDVDIGKPYDLTANPKRISDGRQMRLGFKLNF